MRPDGRLKSIPQSRQRYQRSRPSVPSGTPWPGQIGQCGALLGVMGVPSLSRRAHPSRRSKVPLGVENSAPCRERGHRRRLAGGSARRCMAMRSLVNAATGMWKIVRGAIGIICRPCQHAYLVTPTRRRPGACCTGRCHSAVPAGAGRISGRTRASQRDRSLVHEQHRARRAEPRNPVHRPHRQGDGHDDDRTDGRSRAVTLESGRCGTPAVHGATTSRVRRS